VITDVGACTSYTSPSLIVEDIGARSLPSCSKITHRGCSTPLGLPVGAGG